MKSNYNTYPLALIAGMIIINGCNPEIIPLKGKYETGVSEITSTKPIDLYNFENKEGQLQEPQAWVVLHRTVMNKKERNPKIIYGQWSIQISNVGKGTVIMMAPTVDCTFFPNMLTSIEVKGHSTGKLEELIKSSLTNQ